MSQREKTWRWRTSRKGTERAAPPHRGSKRQKRVKTTKRAKLRTQGARANQTRDNQGQRRKRARHGGAGRLTAGRPSGPTQASKDTGGINGGKGRRRD